MSCGNVIREGDGDLEQEEAKSIDSVKLDSRRKRYPREGMEGKTPFEKLRNLGYGLPREFALFLPVIPDPISTVWLLQTDNNSLAHYILPTFSWPQGKIIL